MMMVGFLKGIGSDRCIAARCADTLILRRFLGYALTEKTPDHSSFMVFRQRLPAEVFQAAHEVVLDGLRAHGLLKGRHLGIDSSVIEANASLRGWANVNKRYLCGILAFNLSLIMRKLTGVGTPRQAAAARAAFLARYEACLRLRTALLLTLTLKIGAPVLILTSIPARRSAPVFSRSRSAAHFSTGS